MTMATETESAPETKDIKDVKEMKEALKDEAQPDNKQQQQDESDVKDKQKQEESGEVGLKKEEDAVAGGDAAANSAVPAKSVTVHKADFEKDVVYLYQFSRTPLLPSLSPPCLKVETWLRFNGIKYEA